MSGVLIVFSVWLGELKGKNITIYNLREMISAQPSAEHWG
jgi:hypothetical protein